ncbi:hypothetical protein MHB48_02195 [Psychrobacillus sp. FSL H8-0483]|uniref:hypothetical protein n=1 Tax=Psychrobacillus sp. FSL H8-0483 TaxID=2921389 RepID=UPI00315A2AAB
MTTNSIAGQKWWKIGAAAFLSVGLLAACGDGENESDVDDNIEQDVEQELDEEDKDGE